VIHKDEDIIPAGGSSSTTVNVYNNAPGIAIDIEEDIDQHIIDVIVNAADTDGPLRNAFGGI